MFLATAQIKRAVIRNPGSAWRPSQVAEGPTQLCQIYRHTSASSTAFLFSWSGYDLVLIND